jgi:hypothetical protein
MLSWDGGATWTVPKTTTTLSTVDTVYLLGSSTDLWNRTWSYADFANTKFRVRIVNISSSTARDFSLDAVTVNVSYQP